MKKLISVLFVLGFVVSGFCQEAQQTQPAPAKSEPVKKAAPVAKKAPVAKTLKMKGRVVSVDAVKGEVVVSVFSSKEKKNIDETVTTDEKTSIAKAGKKIAIADVVSGEKVSVSYSVAADKKVAKSITVLVPPIKKAAPVKKEAVPAQAPAKK